MPIQTKAPYLPLSVRCSSVLSAIEELDVGNSPRYAPEKGPSVRTFCNVYATDVVRALSFSAPTHWYNHETGDETAVGKGAEMTANRLIQWMLKFGIDKGWVMDMRIAAAHEEAKKGRLVLCTQPNPGGPGHVAIMRPDTGGPYVAQAGLTCSSRLLLAKAFPPTRPVSFWLAPVSGR